MDWQLWRQFGRGFDQKLIDANGSIPVRPSSKGLGFAVDFPVSIHPDPNAGPTWNGYLVTEITDNMKTAPSPKPNNPAWNKQHPQPLLPPVLTLSPKQHLVYEFAFVSSDDSVLNYMSDIDNTDTTTLAGFRPLIKQQEWGMMGEQARWWSRQRWSLEKTDGVFRLDVALDPSNWFQVDGLAADKNQAYLDTLNRPTYIGLTFGGGSFAGHGVNVSNGNACFELYSLFTYDGSN